MDPLLPFRDALQVPAYAVLTDYAPRVILHRACCQVAVRFGVHNALQAQRPGRPSKMRLILLRTILGAAVLAVPIAASAGISLSPIMQAWNHDRRSIQAMLSGRIPYDETQIRQELENYITNSSAAARNAHGGSAEARDFAARFAAFANDSRAALDAASQPSALRQNFDRMLSDCRSCHAIYNN